MARKVTGSRRDRHRYSRRCRYGRTCRGVCVGPTLANCSSPWNESCIPESLESGRSSRVAPANHSRPDNKRPRHSSSRAVFALIDGGATGSTREGTGDINQPRPVGDDDDDHNNNNNNNWETRWRASSLPVPVGVAASRDLSPNDRLVSSLTQTKLAPRAWWVRKGKYALRSLWALLSASSGPSSSMACLSAHELAS